MTIKNRMLACVINFSCKLTWNKITYHEQYCEVNKVTNVANACVFWIFSYSTSDIAIDIPKISCTTPVDCARLFQYYWPGTKYTWRLPHQQLTSQQWLTANEPWVWLSTNEKHANIGANRAEPRPQQHSGPKAPIYAGLIQPAMVYQQLTSAVKLTPN